MAVKVLETADRGLWGMFKMQCVNSVGSVEWRRMRTKSLIYHF